MRAVFWVGLLLGALFLWGVPSRASEPPRIERIEILGTTRTTNGTVLSLARARVGDPWREGLDAEILQNLRNARLFYDEEVEVEREGEAVTLRIRLKDKWSLIPIPLVVAKSGESAYGLTLFESNLFGLGKTALVTGVVQDGRPGVTLLYVDPRVMNSDFHLFGYLLHYDRTQQVWDETEKVGSYSERATGGSVGVGYNFDRRTSLSGALRVQQFEENRPQGDAVLPDGGQERAISLRLRYDGADFEEESWRGLSGSLSADRGIAALGDGIGRTLLRGAAKLALNPAERHTLVFALHGLWTNERDHAVEPRNGFLRGYEGGRFRPDRLLGVGTEYQIPLARFREANLSALGFADAALLRDPHRTMAPHDLLADAGVGLAVYLRRIAVPLLQFYVAYGFATGQVLPGFSLGLLF